MAADMLFYRSGMKRLHHHNAVILSSLTRDGGLRLE
jgi:hypothetical protein